MRLGIYQEPIRLQASLTRLVMINNLYKKFLLLQLQLPHHVHRTQPSVQRVGKLLSPSLLQRQLPHHVHRTKPPGSPLCRRLASSYLLHSICDTMVYNSSLFRGLTNLYLSHCICVSLAQLLLSATDFPYSHTDTHLPPLPFTLTHKTSLVY